MESVFKTGPRTGIYLRISDDREGRELGVTRQREDLTDLAAEHGASVVIEYCDNDRGASTLSTKPRPRYQQMIKDAKAGSLDLIVSYSTSRLTRRPRENEDLIDLARQTGVRFGFKVSPAFDLNTADGRKAARNQAAEDAAEVERLAERLEREILQRAEQGIYHGGPHAFGYGILLGQDPKTGEDVYDYTRKVDAEADIVAGWFAKIAAGGTIAGIRKDCWKKNILTKAGQPFHESSITVILRNPRYAGLRILRGVEYPSPCEKIVEPEVWRSVQDILGNPDRKTNHEGRTRKWIGAGLYVCAQCQRTLRTSYDGSKKHGGQLYRSYVCAKRDHGCGRSWKAEPIDAWVTELVEGILGRDDLADLLAKPAVASVIDVEGLRAERIALSRRKKELPDDYGAGLLTRDEFARAKAANEERLGQIGDLLAEAGRVDPMAPILAAESPVDAYRALDDVGMRQAVIRTLMRVELGQPIRGRARWLAEKFITVTPSQRLPGHLVA